MQTRGTFPQLTVRPPKPKSDRLRRVSGVVAGTGRPSEPVHVTGTMHDRRTRAHARARGERD